MYKDPLIRLIEKDMKRRQKKLEKQKLHNLNSALDPFEEIKLPSIRSLCAQAVEKLAELEKKLEVKFKKQETNENKNNDNTIDRSDNITGKRSEPGL